MLFAFRQIGLENSSAHQRIYSTVIKRVDQKVEKCHTLMIKKKIGSSDQDDASTPQTFLRARANVAKASDFAEPATF